MRSNCRLSYFNTNNNILLVDWMMGWQVPLSLSTLIGSSVCPWWFNWATYPGSGSSSSVIFSVNCSHITHDTYFSETYCIECGVKDMSHHITLQPVIIWADLAQFFGWLRTCLLGTQIWWDIRHDGRSRKGSGGGHWLWVSDLTSVFKKEASMSSSLFKKYGC